jgi:hypothetical protein
MTIVTIDAYEFMAAWGNARTRKLTEECMRIKIALLSLGALVAGSFVYPASADKTKMGCERGKEMWDAQAGKCVPGSKASKSAKKSDKK